MGSFSIWHWVIVLIIIALVFGTEKLRNMGSDLGNAVKGFKDGMSEADEKFEKSASVPTTQSGSEDIIDVCTKEKSNF